MNPLKFFFPDLVDGTGGATTPTTVNRTGIMPTKEADLSTVALNASNTWGNNADLTLKWIKQGEFAALATQYDIKVKTTRQQKELKPETVKKLQVLDAQADKAMANVKLYIGAKYHKENAPSYYPQFGIEHNSEGYTFSTDRNERNDQYEDMIEGIHNNGFDDFEFGKDFWTTLSNQYDSLLNSETTLDGNVSTKVGDKRILKNQVRKVLSALIHLIKANYPDTFESVLRDWGFQKEDY